MVADAGCYLCLMHMHGEPRTMQADPRYDDVVSEVKAFLEERLAFAVSAGIREELVCLDPGIGFGKTVEHNFELVRRLPELAAIGRPVVIGISRKSTLARLFDDLGDRRHGRRVGRRRGRRVRARCDDPPRAQRPGPCRGAARGAGGVRGAVMVELRGLELFGYHGVHEEERRDGPDVPLRHRARGRRSRRGRPDRERRRLQQGRGSGARGRGGAVLRCSRRSRPRSPTSWSSGSRPST